MEIPRSGRLLRDSQLVTKIVTDSVLENPQLADFHQDDLRATVVTSLAEIQEIERGVRYEWPNDPFIDLYPEEIERIRFLWSLSGVGTYLKDYKEEDYDRYKDKEWAAKQDLFRLKTAENVIATIAAARRNIATNGYVDLSADIQRLDGFQEIFNPPYKAILAEVRAVIRDYGPHLIYNGRDEENSDLIEAVSRGYSKMPAEKVHIVSGRIARTYDQVKVFNFPDGYQPVAGDRLAVVSHAPHLMRFLHMLDVSKPLPEGMDLQVFPLRSPNLRPANRQEYYEQEIRGHLYYLYIDQVSSPTMHPFIFG